MPEAPTRPSHEHRDRARRPPVLPRPPVRQRVGTDLRRPSRGNSCGRAALSRAARAVGPSEGPPFERNVVTPEARSSQRSRAQPEEQLPSIPRRRIESTCERTRAGRAYEGRGETTGRRVRCSSTRAPRLTLTRACRGVARGARGIRPPSPCLPGLRQQACTSGGKSANELMATMATMATPKLNLEKKKKKGEVEGVITHQRIPSMRFFF